MPCGEPGKKQKLPRYFLGFKSPWVIEIRTGKGALVKNQKKNSAGWKHVGNAVFWRRWHLQMAEVSEDPGSNSACGWRADALLMVLLGHVMAKKWDAWFLWAMRPALPRVRLMETEQWHFPHTCRCLEGEVIGSWSLWITGWWKALSYIWPSCQDLCWWEQSLGVQEILLYINSDVYVL